MASSAILFDGTTDYMTRASALDGVVDSKVGIFSCWVRIDGKDSTSRDLFISDFEKVRIRFQNNNRLQLLFRNGNPAVVFRTSITLTTDPDYFHVLGSWDAENDIVQLYVNDVDRTEQEPPDPTVDLNLDYTVGDWSIGAGFTGNNKFEGATFDLYFQPGELLDLSVEANRRKFITAAGNPVDLGVTGQLPTGTSAAVYLPGDQTNQALNAGTGGDFASQGTQVPGDTDGPGVNGGATLAGVGGFQAAATVIVTAAAILAGVGDSQFAAEGITGTYVPKAILFDGTTDSILRAATLPTIVSNQQGLFSSWIRLDGNDGGEMTVFAGGITPVIEVVRDALNQIRIRGFEASSAQVLLMRSNSTYVSGPTYFHLLASWDLSISKVQIYVDDVSDLAAGATTDPIDIDYGGALEWSVGAEVGGGGELLNGALTDPFFTNEFLDLDVTANRRQFIDSSGNPVFLGNIGILAPDVYLLGDQADQGLNFFNAGGSNFTSSATQVPYETPGPVDDVEGALPAVGESQTAAVIVAIAGNVVLAAAGELQLAGESEDIAAAILPGVAGLQAEGESQGAVGAQLPGVGEFQSIATFIGAVSDATLPGVGGMSVRAVNLDFGIPNEEALVCDPALDSASPGSGTLPRSWNGL